MSHNLLLVGSSAFPAHAGDREALGLPPRYQPPSGGWLFRLERVPARVAVRLDEAAGACGAASRRVDRSAILLEVPPGGTARLLACLRAADPPLPAIAEEIAPAWRALHCPARRLRLARRSLPLGRRTLIQGVLNITPDSFFDGGRWIDPKQAMERAFQMVEEGADLVDVGGESTRPGSRPLSTREEIGRILPVIENLAGRLPVPLSIDTTKADVAEAALSAGAEIVNDVSGLSFDPGLARIVAKHRAGVIVSHIRGRPRTMQRHPRYRHLLPEVLAFLRAGVERATGAGVRSGSILVDPGIGFGKSVRHNLLLLRHLRVLRGAGFPVLVGASRKSFLGKILGDPPGARLEGSLAAAAVAVFNGASALRVHDVAATVRVARVVEAIRDGTTGKRQE